MFSLDDVTLRPLEPSDVAQTYAWHCDLEIEMASGWGPRQSLASFTRRFEEAVSSVHDTLRLFGIEVRGELVGRTELALIDRIQRHASVGLFLGKKELWGQGHAKRTLQLMFDYAFTVENLERVYAHVYAFNERSRGLMVAAGMTEEGVLRRHEVHNGARHDMHVFGILKEEFYASHRTIFEIPASVRRPAGA